LIKNNNAKLLLKFAQSYCNHCLDLKISICKIRSGELRGY